MPIDQQTFARYFSVNDVIPSGGGRSFFRITEILNDRVRIQPTESTTPSRLRFDKLSIVVENYNDIDPRRIEASVGGILAVNGLSDTQNESYLFGMAREYISRQNVQSKSYVESEFQKAIELARDLSSEEIKERLISSSAIPKKITVISTAFQRNPYVVLAVLERAGGVCESCKQPAPFLKAKDGSPYLEVHHIIQLALNGEDTVENAIALCPNCHREMHFGKNP